MKRIVMCKLTGRHLKKIRLVCGLTIPDMRRIVGVKSRKTIMNWEKDIGTPDVNQVFAIMDNLGFSPDEFIELMED